MNLMLYFGSVSHIIILIKFKFFVHHTFHVTNHFHLKVTRIETRTFAPQFCP
jgi:hypothetical protein